MTRNDWRLAAVAAGTAVVLAACGGSGASHSSSPGTTSNPVTTAAATSTSGAKGSDPPATKTRKAKVAAATQARPAAKHHKYGASVPVTEGGTAPVIKSLPAVLPPGATQTEARLVVSCLGKGGLVDAALVRAGFWTARDPVTPNRAFVDGPYKTLKAARESATSLTQVDDTAVGGRFVVSAPLLAHLGDAVRPVAACIGGPAGAWVPTSKPSGPSNEGKAPTRPTHKPKRQSSKGYSF